MSQPNPTSTAVLDKLTVAISLVGISVYLFLQYGIRFDANPIVLAAHIVLNYDGTTMSDFNVHVWADLIELPLLIVIVVGGFPLVYEILAKLLQRDLGADLLAGIAIVTGLFLREYLAASLVVLMLSGGSVLEAYAVGKASSVLSALAKRMPSIAHKQTAQGLSDIPIAQVGIGDILSILPHEICPVDGTVQQGSSTMDESYLTGEPYLMSKTVGSKVLSGAVNGDSLLVIQADKLAEDSRYAKIMTVMRESERYKPSIRRLGDQLGAWYAPLAIVIALTAWLMSGDIVRFLAVLVIATPCPLLIAIPVTIISSISLAAKREIIIKNPAILETIGQCRTAIFDKTGTLTYGRPVLTQISLAPGQTEANVLTLVASLERYSKHPLANSILTAATERQLTLLTVTGISELPGLGLLGYVADSSVQVTSRKHLLQDHPELEEDLPVLQAGLECIVLINQQYAATLQFRDQARSDSSLFINHLKPNHLFAKVMLVSGDRESEVRYLAEQVGIQQVYFSQSPEQKLALVKAETALAKTVFLGDGINDAPALTAATIGIAFGQNSDITGEAADAVIMDSSLLKVDELFHIGERMRGIALQSAVGGMLLSLIGMGFAGIGLLSPVAGAIAQEVIDILAVLNALRAAIPPKLLSDY